MVVFWGTLRSVCFHSIEPKKWRENFPPFKFHWYSWLKPEACSWLVPVSFVIKMRCTWGLNTQQFYWPRSVELFTLLWYGALHRELLNWRLDHRNDAKTLFLRPLCYILVYFLYGSIWSVLANGKCLNRQGTSATNRVAIPNTLSSF